MGPNIPLIILGPIRMKLLSIQHLIIWHRMMLHVKLIIIFSPNFQILRLLLKAASIMKTTILSTHVHPWQTVFVGFVWMFLAPFCTHMKGNVQPIDRKVNHEKSFRNRIPLHRRASTQYLVHKKERVVLSYQKKVRRWLSSQFLVRLCFMPN